MKRILWLFTAAMLLLGYCYVQSANATQANDNAKVNSEVTAINTHAPNIAGAQTIATENTAFAKANTVEEDSTLAPQIRTDANTPSEAEEVANTFAGENSDNAKVTNGTVTWTNKTFANLGNNIAAGNSSADKTQVTAMNGLTLGTTDAVRAANFDETSDANTAAGNTSGYTLIAAYPNPFNDEVQIVIAFTTPTQLVGTFTTPDAVPIAEHAGAAVTTGEAILNNPCVADNPAARTIAEQARTGPQTQMAACYNNGDQCAGGDHAGLILVA